MACSQENTEESFVNEGPPPFTDEEIFAYAEEHQIEIPAILNTSDNDYAAILGNNELHQLYKDENDETVSVVQQIGNGDLEFGSLNAIIYLVIRDKDLLERGERLDINHESGAFSSELVQIDEDSYYTLFDTDRRVEGSVTGAQMIIYDARGETIFEQDLKN
ncbi:hypothetical protein [Planomicrobium sp. Y74]|uniref:hypothetical protein n=1 Tax=Planomicrobium sp. Y74 TaxID=2478977 RepID=UPI0011C3C867|nr:hypothetical protein [Planomicrobium sp. Y74]